MPSGISKSATPPGTYPKADALVRALSQAWKPVIPLRSWMIGKREDENVGYKRYPLSVIRISSENGFTRENINASHNQNELAKMVDFKSENTLARKSIVAGVEAGDPAEFVDDR